MQKIKLLIITGLFLTFTNLTAGENAMDRYRRIIRKVFQDEQQKDYQTALGGYRELLKMSLHDGDTYYRMARLQSLLDQKEEALASFRRALVLGYDFGEQPDSTLISLQEMKGYGKLKKRITQMQTPVSNSRIAYTLPERDLIPEGMAYDPLEDSFYLSSCWKHKIVQIMKDGTYSDFTEERQDGLRTVLGMKVDAERRVLWVASAITRQRPDMDIGEVGWTGLFKYNLETGKLINKYTLFEEGIRHQFNDVAVTSQGDVYVTDSEYQAVYTVHHERDELELFIEPDVFLYPNGITMGVDDRTLYMASAGDGVYRIDISTKEFRLLDQPDTFSLCGIDGLYYYKHSLVCVQNGYRRISRFTLNDEGDGVRKLEILETRNPHFGIPTTGAIAGNVFYYIADAQFNAYQADGSIRPTDQLKDVVILKMDLK